MTTTTPPVALDITLGEREAAPCAVCTATMPAADTPIYELEEAVTGNPICRPCARRIHPELAGAVAFLTTLTRAFDTGDAERARDALAAVLNGVELYYEHHGLTMPTVPATAARRPRYAPGRKPRRRR